MKVTFQRFKVWEIAHKDTYDELEDTSIVLKQRKLLCIFL